MSVWISKNRRKRFLISVQRSEAPEFWHRCLSCAAFTRCLQLPAVSTSVDLTPHLKFGVAGTASAATNQGAAVPSRTSLAPNHIPDALTRVFASPQHVGLAPTRAGGARTQGRASKSLPQPSAVASSVLAKPPTRERQTNHRVLALKRWPGRRPDVPEEPRQLPGGSAVPTPTRHPTGALSPCIAATAGMAAGAEPGGISLAGEMLGLLLRSDPAAQEERGQAATI